MARHGRGADDPKLVINFFCSFQSQHCGWTWDAIREVMRVYPDQIYLQFNHLFDERDPNQPAVGLAHEAALCAEDQAAFWDYYDYQFGRVQNRPPQQLGESDLRATAQSLGIDEEAFMKCVASGTHGAEVEALRVKARLAGIRRTPSVVINGRLYEGKFTRGPLLKLVASELRPGLLEQQFPVELHGLPAPSADNR
jgi:protein-disulfide isomerase